VSAFVVPKTKMNESTAVFATSWNSSSGDRRQDGTLHPHHRADECVDDDEERELPEVLAQAESGTIHHAASERPWFASRMLSISAGFGGTSASASTNSSLEHERSGFQRFSKAIVLDGFPLIPEPQADPAK
jgi:hypothetical protein